MHRNCSLRNVDHSGSSLSEGINIGSDVILTFCHELTPSILSIVSFEETNLQSNY